MCRHGRVGTVHLGKKKLSAAATTLRNNPEMLFQSDIWELSAGLMGKRAGLGAPYPLNMQIFTLWLSVLVKIQNLLLRTALVLYKITKAEQV